LIKVCSKYKGKILFIGPTLVDESKVSPMPWNQSEIWQNERIVKYSSIIEKTCLKERVEFINMINLFNKNNYDKYLADGAHPNTKGHKLIFETLKNYLEKNKYI
jgi:lysophospholipase L1-like esterase